MQTFNILTNPKCHFGAKTGAGAILRHGCFLKTNSHRWSLDRHGDTVLDENIIANISLDDIALHSLTQDDPVGRL